MKESTCGVFIPKCGTCYHRILYFRTQKREWCFQLQRVVDLEEFYCDGEHFLVQDDEKAKEFWPDIESWEEP